MNYVMNRNELSNTSSKNTTPPPPRVAWQQSGVRHRRRMDDGNAEDEPAKTLKDDWKRNNFYVSLDTIINSLKDRFEKNQPLLQAFSDKLIR